MRLVITDPGSLLSVVEDREVTPEQAEFIKAILMESERPRDYQTLTLVVEVEPGNRDPDDWDWDDLVDGHARVIASHPSTPVEVLTAFGDEAGDGDDPAAR